MKYVISLHPIEELVKLNVAPSPLIVKRVNKKDLMIALLYTDTLDLWGGNNAPIYAYVMKDAFYDTHFARFGTDVDDDGGIGEKIIEFASHPSEQMDRNEYEKVCNMRKYNVRSQMARLITSYCWKSNMVTHPYYGFALQDMTIRFLDYVEIGKE